MGERAAADHGAATGKYVEGEEHAGGMSAGTHADSGEGTPLLYYRGGYGRFAPPRGRGASRPGR